MASARHPNRPVLVADLRKMLAQPNPIIPLHFEPTQDRMVAFKSALTAYVTNNQAEITRRKEKYDTLQRREKDKSAKMNTEIEQFRVDEMNLMKNENRGTVDVELEGLRVKTEKLKIEKSKDLAKLEHQPVEPNVVKIKFTHIDEDAPTREFSFVIDLSGARYKVSTSSPLLPQMSGLVDWLNETREFYWFVKKVRMAFQQYVQDERRARA
ncbi:chromosome segregation protein spc25 [Ceratobasidium sp. AG-Ba]|nr:chromosome segregation protein spc25 [Ceratobasidium sp. AG-Ba]